MESEGCTGNICNKEMETEEAEDERWIISLTASPCARANHIERLRRSDFLVNIKALPHEADR